MNAEKCFHELYFITIYIYIYVDDYFLAGLLQGNQDRYSILRIKKKGCMVSCVK